MSSPFNILLMPQNTALPAPISSLPLLRPGLMKSVKESARISESL